MKKDLRFVSPFLFDMHLAFARRYQHQQA